MTLLADRHAWLDALMDRLQAETLDLRTDENVVEAVLGFAATRRLALSIHGGRLHGVEIGLHLSGDGQAALLEAAAWLAGTGADVLQTVVPSRIRTALGAVLWTARRPDGPCDVLPPPDAPNTPPGAIRRAPEGVCRLVAGLSAHGRLAYARTLPALDAGFIGHLLRPAAGDAPAQALLVRAGSAAALADGSVPFPLFWQVP